MVVLRAFGLFVLAGLFEIGGGWLVWQWMREHQAVWYAVAGTAVVALYGFVPPLQNFPHFGRVFAAYGGVFIVLSLFWGLLFDGFRPDRWDLAGAGLCLAGVSTMLFAPR
jgi:small multidrug resistance family-3 protein